MRSPSPSATFIGWACRARARAPSTRPVPRAAPPAGAHSDCRADRMIAHLRGRLLEKHPNRVIVDVQGVGYEAHVPLSTFYGLAEPGSDITLRIHTHMREEDRKSTRLNSSHMSISYAVFCLKKKNRRRVLGIGEGQRDFA